MDDHLPELHCVARVNPSKVAALELVFEEQSHHVNPIKQAHLFRYSWIKYLWFKVFANKRSHGLYVRTGRLGYKGKI